MNKIIPISIILLAILLTGCSWENEDMDYSEPQKVYRQVRNVDNDSSFVSGDGNSTYISRIEKLRNRNVVSSVDSSQCSFKIFSKLIVDNGSSSDLSDTFVTVEKIDVHLWRDGNKDPVVFSPKISRDVAEPSDVYTWETLPVGVNYDCRELCEQPLVFSYAEYFFAEVKITFILRVRDTELAVGCTADRFYCESLTGSSSLMEKSMNLLVPLELHTIIVNASVDGWSSEDINR